MFLEKIYERNPNEVSEQWDTTESSNHEQNLICVKSSTPEVRVEYSLIYIKFLHHTLNTLIGGVARRSNGFQDGYSTTYVERTRLLFINHILLFHAMDQPQI